MTKMNIKRIVMYLTPVIAALIIISACSHEDKLSDSREPNSKGNQSESADIGDYHICTAFCEFENAIYFTGSIGRGDQNLIYYYDKESGQTGPLCGKAECGHEDSSCNAWAGNDKQMRFLARYDDGLVLVSTPLNGSLEEANDLCIYALNPDGTGRKTLRQLKNPWDGAGRINTQFLMLGDYMILSGLKQTIQDADYWNIPFVYAFAMQKEETVILYEGEKTKDFPRTILQTCGRELCFLNEQETRAEDGTIQTEASLLRWRQEQSSPDMIYEGLLPAYMFELWPGRDEIRFCKYGSAGLYKYGLNNQAFEVVYRNDSEEAEGLYGCFSEGIAALTRTDTEEGIQCTISVYNETTDTFSQHTSVLKLENFHTEELIHFLCGSDNEALYYYIEGYKGIEIYAWMLRISPDKEEIDILWKNKES